MSHEKNNVASEINDKITYSVLKLKILSAIKFIRSKLRAVIKGICDQLMKMNASNLENSSTDEVLSNLINCSLV